MAKRIDPPKVYLATAPNGKQYVGITTATLSVRKSEHFSKAKKGSKLAFHRALNKYGQNIKWEVIIICDTFERAKNIEIKLIEKLNTFAPNGYNLTKGGDGFKGYKLSEENRRVLSESHKGYVMPQEQKDKIGLAHKGSRHKCARQVERTCLITGEKKIYESLTDIKREEEFDYCCVSKCCLGERKTHKNYTWRYIDNLPLNEDLSNKLNSNPKILE